MKDKFSLPVQQGCACMGMSRSALYYQSIDPMERDAEIIAALNQLTEAHPRWGVWKYVDRLRALAIEIDTSLRAPRVVRVLERLKSERGVPNMLRLENGPEFISQELKDWCEENGVMIRHIQPGKPNQNAYIDRFNRTYRSEVLNLYLFRSLDEVRQIISRWIEVYNEHRPHDVLWVDYHRAFM